MTHGAITKIEPMMEGTAQDVANFASTMKAHMRTQRLVRLRTVGSVIRPNAIGDLALAIVMEPMTNLRVALISKITTYVIMHATTRPGVKGSVAHSHVIMTIKIEQRPVVTQPVTQHYYKMRHVILVAITGNVPMTKVTALDVHKNAKIRKVYIKAPQYLVRQRMNVILRHATGALDGAIVTKPRNVRQICKLTTCVMKHATLPHVTTTILPEPRPVILAVTMHY